MCATKIPTRATNPNNRVISNTYCCISNTQMNSGIIQTTPTDRRPSKLTDELKQQVCKRLAAFIGPTKICRWLQSEHGITIDKSTVLHYRDSDKWADQFARYRAEWQAGTRDRLWLANVGGRVEELQKMYEAVHKGLGDAAASDKRSIRGELRAILEQIQTELPGAEVGAAGSVININLPENVKQGLFMEKDKGD